MLDILTSQNRYAVLYRIDAAKRAGSSSRSSAGSGTWSFPILGDFDPYRTPLRTDGVSRRSHPQVSRAAMPLPGRFRE
jgi:hypothetical protein